MKKAFGAAAIAVAVLFFAPAALAQTGAVMNRNADTESVTAVSDAEMVTQRAVTDDEAGDDRYIRSIGIAIGVGVAVFIIAYLIGHSSDRKLPPMTGTGPAS